MRLLLTRLVYSFVNIWFIIFYYLFIIWFLKEKGWYLLLGKVIIICESILFLLVTLTDFVIVGVDLGKWGIIPTYSIVGAPLYHLIVVALTVFITGRLIVKYFKLPKEEQLKIQYFLLGVVIFVSGNLTFAVFLPFIFGITNYLSVAHYSTIFLIGFTAYAIVKQNLFGIKVVLVSFFVAIIEILLFLDAFILTKEPVSQVLKRVFLVFFLFFGYYLIRATHAEEKRRGTAEILAAQEKVLRESAEKMVIREMSLRKKLERMNRARGQFLLSSQHYFRTPLTAIRGFLELCLEKDLRKKMPEEVVGMLEGARKGAEELRKRIEESLEISRLEAGKGMFELQEVQLADLVNEVVEEIQGQAKFKKISLVFNKPFPTPQKIKLDPAKMREALSNIVENAVKHTQKGTVDVTLEELTDKKAILFCVKDNGIGIPKEELAYIGTIPFERGKGSKKLSPMGKGVGLYLSRLIIEAHGGKLWAESEGAGKGATFYVQLPTTR